MLGMLLFRSDMLQLAWRSARGGRACQTARYTQSLLLHLWRTLLEIEDTIQILAYEMWTIDNC